MLNQRIRELRLNRNMSQVELAHRIGVTKQSVSNWENDNIMPSIEMLVRIANVFSVTTDYLIGLCDKELLDVTGLSPAAIAHLKQIVDDLKNINASNLAIVERDA